MNKLKPRLERLESIRPNIHTINRIHETEGVKALTDEQLLFAIRYATKTTGIDYSALTDDELQQMINAEKGAG